MNDSTLNFNWAFGTVSIDGIRRELKSPMENDIIDFEGYTLPACDLQIVHPLDEIIRIGVDPLIPGLPSMA
jgi:hypothetical protein